MVHSTYLGVSDYSFQNLLYFCLKIIFTFTNSVDPGEMQLYAAFNKGLHCLQSPCYTKGFIQCEYPIYRGYYTNAHATCTDIEFIK